MVLKKSLRKVVLYSERQPKGISCAYYVSGTTPELFLGIDISLFHFYSKIRSYCYQILLGENCASNALIQAKPHCL